MKANELMIGDWVKYTRKRDQYNRVIKNPKTIFIRIESIVEEGVNEEYHQCDFEWIEYNEIEPIPLTEEILKANGFTRNGMFMSKCWNDSDIIYANGSFDNHIDISTCGNDCHSEYLNIRLPHIGFGMPMYYVHELQHALRLFALDKLADNFKIE
ncbi:MAG: hypothetical protein MJZ41_07760 [Bacteroidaceae bacterium]|nr:hypothetical protein [Bacteroidaceae bacterium]